MKKEKKVSLHWESSKIVSKKNDNEKQPEKYRVLTREELEKKAWFRVIKTFYIILILVAIVTIAIFLWEVKPSASLNYSKSSILCDNSEEYFFNDLGRLYTHFSIFSIDEFAQSLCNRELLNHDSFPKFGSKIELKNYEVNKVYDPPVYDLWILFIILSYFLLFNIALGIKIVFYYVVLGEKPNFNIF